MAILKWNKRMRLTVTVVLLCLVGCAKVAPESEFAWKTKAERVAANADVDGKIDDIAEGDADGHADLEMDLDVVGDGPAGNDVDDSDAAVLDAGDADSATTDDAPGTDAGPGEVDDAVDAGDAGTSAETIDAGSAADTDAAVDLCTGTTACQVGLDDACYKHVCQPLTGSCLAVAVTECNDGNPCTDDACDPANGCGGKPNDAPCNDGDACTVADACKAGTCLPGAVTACDDGNPCTADSCAAKTGCSHAAVTGLCSDGDACTEGDACKDGACLPGGVTTCDDGNPCTSDSCMKAQGCQQVPSDGIGCDDGNACTAPDLCGKSGACDSGAPAVCDPTPCHDAVCDPTSGCGLQPNNAKACTDGNACTLGDKCSGGACLPGAVTSCDDGNGCTLDACDKASGCVNTGNSEPCSDGNECTEVDACIAGVCKSGAAPNCDDGDSCTTDACNPGSGCTHVALGAGASCGGGLACVANACTAAYVPAGMTIIPAGTFWMGCNSSKDANCNPNELPQHKVTLSAYYMDQTETTAGQYKACVDAGGCTVPGDLQPAPLATYPGLTNHPVNMVTPVQAEQYCKWRGAAYALPTEAQWEMGARGSCEKNGSAAGDANCAKAMRTYPWGDASATCSYAVMSDGLGGCGTGATWNVGSKLAGDSPYGLHDMAGNVWEWVRGWYGAYTAKDQTDPIDPGTGAERTCRGGGFGNSAAHMRGAERYSQPPSATTGPLVGFRCSLPFPATNPCASQPDGTACEGDKFCVSGDCTPSYVPTGMTVIPAGTFWMGCNSSKDGGCTGAGDESPQHKVTLSAYLMDLTETTVGKYKACVDAGVCTAPSSVQTAPYATYPGLTNNPVNFVSWTQSRAYCKWRGGTYDLPTEAQWEMAARGSCEKNGSAAGDANCAKAMRTYPWGEAAATCSHAVISNGAYGCGMGATWAVGQKPAGDSPYGLHDMVGNVFEWNRDWLAAYTAGDQTDPTGPGGGSYRVARGGSFDVIAEIARASVRGKGLPAGSDINIGFRCSLPFPTANPCASQPDGTACEGSKFCVSGACIGVLAGYTQPCSGGAGCTCSVGYVKVENAQGFVCAPDYPVWGDRPGTPAGLLLDGGNGTVSDSQTKLTWQQGFSATKMAQAAAVTYCKGLGPGLAGKTDWRLPTVAEFYTIRDLAKYNPALPAEFAGTPPFEFFWTSVDALLSPSSAWLVFFYYGSTAFDSLAANSRVRCVRSESASAAGATDRYLVDAAAGTVYDSATKLTWQRTVSAATYSWANAKTYCLNPGLGGSGWHLPTLPQLESLVDRQKYNPSIDVTAFAGAPAEWFWSASAGSWASATWSVDFKGGASSGDVTGSLRARCVR